MYNSVLESCIEKINLLLEQEGANPLPDLYKHMVLAIFREGPKTEQNFLRAMEAAFSFLLRRGHITPDSNIQKMTLTSSGASLDRPHEAEPASKSNLFDAGLEAVKGVG